MQDAADRNNRFTSDDKVERQPRDSRETAERKLRDSRERQLRDSRETSLGQTHSSMHTARWHLTLMNDPSLA